jgi:hypothetical protein
MPAQRAWIIFAGRADHGWQRWLRPGFRHCFAAIEDSQGWLVLEALTGRLLLARLEVPSGFDAPGFYRRAGMIAVGPFPLEEADLGRVRGPWPMNCVSICRGVLGPHAPFALTPHGLYRALTIRVLNRKINLTHGVSPR